MRLPYPLHYFDFSKDGKHRLLWPSHSSLTQNATYNLARCTCITPHVIPLMINPSDLLTPAIGDITDRCTCPSCLRDLPLTPDFWYYNRVKKCWSAKCKACNVRGAAERRNNKTRVWVAQLPNGDEVEFRLPNHVTHVKGVRLKP